MSIVIAPDLAEIVASADKVIFPDIVFELEVLIIAPDGDRFPVPVPAIVILLDKSFLNLNSPPLLIVTSPVPRESSDPSSNIRIPPLATL